MKRLFHLLLLILLTGCNTIEVKKQLQDIESYIAARPDSALSVIESMDSTALKTRGLKAHHALLHAMALDKNYIDVTDDSLALTAVNWYRNHGPKKNLARSMYYLALSYFYDRQYDRSIVKLAETEPIAEKYDSLYWGFVKVLQADIYSINYNEIAELEALQQALDIYCSLNDEYYINVAKTRLSTSYINNEKYDEASLLLKELIESRNLNHRMKLKTIGDYAFLMAIKPDADYSQADYYYEKVAFEESGRYMSKQDYWVWAYALSKAGKTDKALEIIKSLEQVDTSSTAYHFLYLIAKNQNNITDAFRYLEKFSEKNNEEVIEILKQSISVIQRDYYHSQYETADYKARNRLLTIILITTTSFLLILIICIYIKRYRKEKEQEKNNYIRYAEEVIRQLKELQKDSYSALQKKYVSMYKTKYETIRDLYYKYIQSDRRVDAESLIYKKVVSLINDLRHEIVNNTKLERMLDEDLNGLLTQFHTEYPEFSKRDYTLMAYLTLGFDATLISHFMNCTPNSIYIRKSRLKKIIEEADTEHKEVFLEIIG